MKEIMKMIIMAMCLLVVMILFLSTCQAEETWTTVLDTNQDNAVIILEKNVPVTYVAEPEEGYVFVGWSGACTGKGDCVIIPTKDGERFELYARFAKKVEAPKNLRKTK